MPVFLRSRMRSLSPRLPAVKSLVQRILTESGQPRAIVSIDFIGDGRMRRLNHRYRGRDTTTDVLAFAMRDAAGPHSDLLGDVVISIPTAAKQAVEHGHTVAYELAVLLIHGILHLLGYDHERNAREARRMQHEERKILRAVLPIPPIIDSFSIHSRRRR